MKGLQFSVRIYIVVAKVERNAHPPFWQTRIRQANVEPCPRLPLLLIFREYIFLEKEDYQMLREIIVKCLSINFK